jgi:lipopolysaccharide/colanic/teichoic acid biosynthesis glycosyltransferase
MLTDLDSFHSSQPPARLEFPARKARRGVIIDAAFAKLPAPSFAQRVYLPLRRLLDLALGLVLTLAALPIVLLAAAAIKLSSRGPAFYTQVRTGRLGRPFTIYKLRTMIHNCESLTGPRWTMPGDPRVTLVGRLLRSTHLDELPQLFNVLRGEMSLIGPRPERPEFVAELEKHIPGYYQRHQVLPGITGLAQVQLPPDTDIESVRSKLHHDLHFIRHVSPWLDARVLLATMLHLFGVSYARLRHWGVVPKPPRYEADAVTPVFEPAPFNQAA